jgi:hypothetical protein
MDWTGLSSELGRGEMRRREGNGNGEWQPYRGWSLGGGLVWYADGPRLTVGKSVEEGPVAGAEFQV